MTMDAGYDDRDFELPPGAVTLIRAQVADGHHGLRQLLIEALACQQSDSALDRAGLARLIEEHAAREQLGCWYFAALAAQDRAAETAEAVLRHADLDAVTRERLVALLSELRAAEAVAERAVEHSEFAAAEAPEAGVHPGSLVEPVEFILKILGHTSEPAARDRILAG
jgi:hypothetical protein